MISIIVTTYNWPQALGLVLQSLDRQSGFEQFEVIIADDGSSSETKQLIENYQRKVNYPLLHFWQEDKGFRAATCRNKAVLKSAGDYLIFLDGDCIVRPDFVAQHDRIKETGWFVRGNRVKLNANFTEQLMASQSLSQLTGTKSLLRNWLTRGVQRLIPLLNIPVGKIRYLKKKDWYGVKTCNLGVYKEDFFNINGFNEEFEGWGHEDADLAIRLIRNGIYRKEGIFSTTVFHCHHNERDRSSEEKNRNMLDQSMTGDIKVRKGLIQSD